ncbi:MAG TPA: squalene/phytoene synthase family protein [Alphaproteobacteria bacterium]|nr:squalene/phytoene synthase family protein [Alphaproteobacteria bacterium]
MSGASDIARRVRRVGSTFYWAMRMMPRAKREAMFAIYAFAREIDDIADGPGTPETKRIGLDIWRREIVQIYAGRPTSTLGGALAVANARFDLPREEFEALVDGMSIDAEGSLRAPGRDELARYCRLVAGSVGLLSLRVFGCAGADERTMALKLGEAMQLTNILRDLVEDASRGRLYLPREVLHNAGIALDDPNAALAHPRIGEACAALAADAEELFAAAERLLLRSTCRRSLAPASLMMASYRRLLAKLRAGAWPATARPRLSIGEKLALTARVAMLARP